MSAQTVEIVTTDRSRVDFKLKQTRIAQFANWLKTESKDGTIVSHLKAAKYISQTFYDGDKIYDKTLFSWVVQARLYSTKHLGCTIWNVRGEGWRIATKKETAITLIRKSRSLIKSADNVRNLSLITDRQYIPEAMQAVYGSTKKAVEQLHSLSPKFLELYKEHITPQITDQTKTK